MESRNINLIINKDGHGTEGYKLSLPSKWIRKMGFTSEDRKAIIEFNDKEIIIRKEN